MEPPLSSENLSLISCPLGRFLAVYPFLNNSSILLLYGCKTRLLLALGYGVLDNHHTVLIASFTLTLRTFTYSAGVGSLEGFHQ